MLSGLAFVGLALMTVFALVPVPGGSATFPDGNLIGPFGAWLGGALRAALGFGAPLVPLLFGSLGWLTLTQRMRARRWRRPGPWLALISGLIVLVPVSAHVVASGSGGWLGATLATPLVAAVGWLGASVIALLGLAALSQLALGWDPVTAAAAAMGRGAGGAVARARRALRARRASRPTPTGTGARRGGRHARGRLKHLPDAADAEAPESAREPGEAEGPDARTATVGGASDTSPAELRDTELPETGPLGQAHYADGGQDRAFPQTGSEHGASDGAISPALGCAATPTPGIGLLPEPRRSTGDSEEVLDERERRLINTLRTFKVECRPGRRETGPAVTQFRIVPNKGVKVSRIVNLAPDLALAVRAETLRIVAPIPGEGAVGIEVPNAKRSIVGIREIIGDASFRLAEGALPLAFGKDIRGRPYVTDLTLMPHLLIAGQTGSGKSVCLNTIITSLIYKHGPHTLRLLMIDPKMVELSIYGRLPHLRHDVVTDPREAAAVLEWAVMEMERRYTLLRANGVRSLAEFNARVVDEEALAESGMIDPEDLPYDEGVIPFIVVVVDELADLMMTVQSDVEKPLTQLAQKARAIGIHLIIATQRPSVNVITGLIKANFPTRMAFRVASKTDSRTILDMNGAEALLGNGDMLFLPPGEGEPVRIQGAFISTADTERLMQWYEDLAESGAEVYEAPEGESDILEEVRSRAAEDDDGGALKPSDLDPIFADAAELCIGNGSASTSLLQRRLKVGYGRAARVIDQLHDAGIVGRADGARGREILVSMDELEAILRGER